MKRALLAALALAGLFMASPLLAAESDDAYIAKLNEFRAAHDLPRLSLNAKLEKTAQRHAEAMAAGDALSHNGPDGSLTERLIRTGYAYATAAENIGSGARTFEEALASWVQSPPHARNLLLASVREAGVGHAQGKADSRDAPDYWCLILAEPAEP